MNKQRPTNASISRKFRRYVLEHPEVYPDAEEFLAILETWPIKAARANGQKTTIEELCKLWNIEYDPVAWCVSATHFDFHNKIGSTKEHQQGLCYVSDPSSMLVVEMLDIESNSFVIDMCAAPGGKSAHILNQLGPEGTLILNDVNRNRIRILQENISRMLSGIPEEKRPQVVVENIPITGLVEHYRHMADVVLLDAPCSGEAMMRRSDMARHQWSEKLVMKMSILQKQLLFHATQLLGDSGKIGYSTCTFNTRENDDVVQFGTDELGLNVVARHEVENIPGVIVRQAGVTLFPHRVRGDGQFASVLERNLQ